MPPVPSEKQEDRDAAAAAALLKERRFKLSRACDRCRRRRIKCDEGHPCQACLAANSACTFEEPGKRHPHKSKRQATLEDRLYKLESLIAAIPPAVFAAGSGGSASHSGNAGASNSSNGPTSPTSPTTTAPYITPQTQDYSGVPPPSLHVFPLTNPSTHFTTAGMSDTMNNEVTVSGTASFFSAPSADQMADDAARTSLHASYLYFDDEGYTRWQGETSGLPLLDMLVERHANPNPQNARADGTFVNGLPPDMQPPPPGPDWFPDRTLRRTDVNPETMWRLITAHIVPELMDSLVQCYLSTSYYIMPFLHVPTFLADYGNPQKWGEPGFAAFIVSICCLSSRHIDDPRVRSDPSDGISAGTQWFELLYRLRTLPIADRPTLYTIQADLIAAVYAVGLGKLSKAAALLSEAVTMCIDAGLHRCSDTYDLFDPIEDEVRKRTFWCVYIWDKQLAAHFGRPAMIRLRDCDVGEPSAIDDEYISHDSVQVPHSGTESCRMSAFVCSIRIMVVFESVLDVPPPRQPNADGQFGFLARASSVLCPKKMDHNHLSDEEALLDEIHRTIPSYWSHDNPETTSSADTIRLTQAERLHCAEMFVRMMIYRHRFSLLVAERTTPTTPGDSQEEAMGGEQTEREREAMVSAHNAALEIIATHLQIAKKGLMTYYGVHVIHQLTQAGRTLVAVLLNCQSDALQHLIPPGLDAVRSCVALLKRFSGRYVCGLRSGDIMEEFCRLTRIPLETAPRGPGPDCSPESYSYRPAWIRPVRKKANSIVRSNGGGAGTSHSSGDSPSHHSSPEAYGANDYVASSPTQSTSSHQLPPGSQSQQPHPPPFHPATPTSSPMTLDPSMFGMSPDMLTLFNANGTAGEAAMNGMNGVNAVMDINQLFAAPGDFGPVGAGMDGSMPPGFAAASANGFE